MPKIAYYFPMFDSAELAERLRAFPDTELQIAECDDEIEHAVNGAEILITGNRFYGAASAALIRRNSDALRWVAFLTSGIDNAIKHGLPSGVVVTNVAGTRAFAVAEHALALMLGLARNFRASEAARVSEYWSRDDMTPLMANLARRRLVIVGTGSVGQKIARLATAFGMHVTGISRSTTPLPAFDELRPRAALVDAAREADYLLLAATASPETDGIISRDVIAALSPTAFLVNIARGSLVDESALIEALQAGRIAGAGLDVVQTEPLPPGHPFWKMKNVLLTPHVGGPGDPAVSSEASLFIDNLQRWRTGQPLRNVVMDAALAQTA